MNKVALFGIYRSVEMEAAALEVLRSGQIASGVHVDGFRRAFGALADQQHVVTTNDMSNAMQIALHLAGVRPGDDVLTTAYACMSTNASIATAGARAVWVDVDPETGLMDVADLERAITSRTKAVILYHVAGYPGPVEAVARLCRERGIKLIEDCDNALLATVNGHQVGTFGDFAIYSFYPNRQINATEGGALACRREEDAARAQRLRRYGIDLPRFRDQLGEIDPASDIPEVGWAATLNNLCSAMGLTQLPGVRDRMEVTRAVAKQLSQRLSALPQLKLVQTRPGVVPSYWALMVRVSRRDWVLGELKARGVQASKLHHRTDTYTGFNALQRDLPGTAVFMDTVIGLPCGWWLQQVEIDHLVSTVEAVVDAL